MLEHLDVFTEWATRRYSDVKSQWQLGFLGHRLDDAVKAHRVAGLPVHEMPDRNVRCYTFFISADADVMVDTDYIMVELFGYNASINSMRLVVNFGKDAAEQMGYVWQNRWVKLEGVK